MAAEPETTADAPQAAPRDGAYADLARFFDEFAPEDGGWRARNWAYHAIVEQLYRFAVPPGASVLEIGCGTGELLAALRPREGVGVDVSPRMVELARRRHPELEFVAGAGETLSAGRTFDYIVLSDLMPYVHDLLALFRTAAAHSHRRTRIIVNSYSALWRPVIAVAEALGLKPPKPIRNWVAPDDIRNLLQLAGLEVVSEDDRILLPKQVPGVTTLANGVLGNLWPLWHLCLTSWVVARPRAEAVGERGVSVVCPCRNEEGHVPDIVRRLPAMGERTELIFVEGGSTDGTRAAIEREIERHPDREISLIVQRGKGKGDAVREGFDAARYDVLMILDGDLSVPPEDLPKFYEALVEGRGDFVNGSRLVYQMEPGAMRFLNMVGNKAFARVFKGITRQPVKDMLCGTKVLFRDDYRAIAAGRAYFGDFDPFGDFDLLFGAAKLNLKIVDLPVRYHPRVYGQTNISRFRHGLLLLQMAGFAFWKFRVDPVRARRARVAPAVVPARDGRPAATSERAT